MAKDVKFESVKMKLSSGSIKEKAARDLIVSNAEAGWELIAALPIVSGLLFKRERLIMVFQKND